LNVAPRAEIIVYDIAYGAIEKPEAALGAGDKARATGLTQSLGPYHASIATGGPALRLNSPGWMNLTLDVAANLRTHQALKDYCRWRIEKKAPLFARPLQRFLVEYLDFIERRVRENAAILPGGRTWDDAIFCVDDWFFSAFLPLPNAHLRLSDAESVAAGGARFLRFDVVFWTGEALTAVTLDNRAAMPTPRQRRAYVAYAQMRPDIRFLTIPVEETGAEFSFESDCWPRGFATFWEGLAFPYGPLRPEAFTWRPDAI
jgi:hypothetical protein